MIIVFFVLFAAVSTLSCHKLKKGESLEGFWFWLYVFILSLSLCVACVIGVCGLWHEISTLPTIDEKIQMYEAENEQIKTNIYNQPYSLIESEINRFAQNKNKILELKLKQLDVADLRWWLYFGK